MSFGYGRAARSLACSSANAASTASPEFIRRAVAELNLTFPVAIDSKATEAEIKAGPDGARWGSTFAAFKQLAYLGTVLIDREGTVIEVPRDETGIFRGFSPFEILVREYLREANGTADPPTFRRTLVERTSRVLLGRPAEPDELQAAVDDPSRDWQRNAQQKILALVSDDRRQIFERLRQTVDSATPDPSTDEWMISGGTFHRIQAEWRRRAASIKGTGSIRVRLLNPDGNPYGSTSVHLTPTLTVLSSLLGSYMKGIDPARIQTTNADDSGNIEFHSLAKGAYEITVDIPGRKSLTRMAYLTTNDSTIDLEIVIDRGE